jgi:hypothetical protein
LRELMQRRLVDMYQLSNYQSTLRNIAEERRSQSEFADSQVATSVVLYFLRTRSPINGDRGLPALATAVLTFDSTSLKKGVG